MKQIKIKKKIEKFSKVYDIGKVFKTQKIIIIIMGFYRKFNTILKSIDNIKKLYKISKSKKENKK